jgi:hypothetical protein
VDWLSQHVHLGDLPTWLAAVGAAIAAVFAFGQLKALRAQNRHQQDQLDEVRATQRKQAELLDLDIRERRSGQARGVNVRRDVRPWQDPGSSVRKSYAQFLSVANNSRGSISDLDAFFWSDGEQPRRAMFSVDTKYGHIPVERLDVGQAIEIVGPMLDQAGAERTMGYVSFTDSDGRGWKVDHAGLLTEVRADDSGQAT